MVAAALRISIAAAFGMAIAFGQAKGPESIKTTVCDVVKSPESFSGKIITLRSPVKIASESFGLPISECAAAKFEFPTLEYGRGPKRQPAIWCCGDLTPRDRLKLIQNEEFKRC